MRVCASQGLEDAFLVKNGVVGLSLNWGVAFARLGCSSRQTCSYIINQRIDKQPKALFLRTPLRVALFSLFGFIFFGKHFFDKHFWCPLLS